MIHWLVPILLLAGVSGQGLNVTLQCQSADDVYLFLFQICDESRLCRGLYQLDSGETTAQQLLKFTYQVSLLEFFLVDGNVSDWPHPRRETTEELRFLAHIWPTEWQPNFLVQFNASGDSCAATFSLTAPENLPVIYVLLDLLKTYRQYIAIETLCGPNERLLFEPHYGGWYCFCPPGKSCDRNDGNFQGLIKVLLVLLLGLVLILIFFVAVVGIRFFRALPGQRPSLTQ